MASGMLFLLKRFKMQENRRFYVNSDCFQGEFVKLQGSEFNHLVNVLRAKIGDELIININDGKDIFCKLVEIGKGFANLECIRSEQNLCEPKLHITLFQALPKGDKLELIVQKAVELGMSKIVPFTSNFTVAKDNPNKTERLNKISVEASKQCGRAIKVDVEKTITINELYEKLVDFDDVFFCFEGEKENSIKTVLQKSFSVKKPEKVALIIGSEGGFSEKEAKKLVDCGAKVVSLGRRIMRCETAAIASMAIVMYEFNEMVI